MPTNPLKSLIVPVYTPAALFSTSAGIVSSVLILSALSLGFSDAGASALAGLLGVIGVLFSPTCGRIIVRIGDRTALLIAGALGVVAVTLLFVTMQVGSHSAVSKAIVVASIVGLGLANVIWALARQAYVTDAVPAQWRARALSTLGGMNRIGALIGPLIATAIVAVWWLGAAYIGSIVLVAVASAIVAHYLAPATKPAAPVSGPSASLAHKRIPSLAATVIMGITMNGVAILRAIFAVVIPLWGTHLGASETLITATFAATALLDTVMFIVAGGTMDRWGRQAAIGPTLVIMTLGIIIMVVSGTIPGYVIGAAILGFGNGFGAGTVMTVGADLSPSVDRASFLGIWQAIVNVGGAAGPFIVSAVTHVWGIPAALWTCAGIGLGCAAWMALTIKGAYRRLGVDLRGLPL